MVNSQLIVCDGVPFLETADLHSASILTKQKGVFRRSVAGYVSIWFHLYLKMNMETQVKLWKEPFSY